MKKTLNIVLVILLLAGLIGVRFWQEQLFYDPLLVFFEGVYLNAEKLPDLDFRKLLISISARFWLNSTLSLSMLFLLFRKSGIVKISFLVYLVVFILLLVGFALVVLNYTSECSLLLFYIRRFLIQPILVLILVPAFYYHKIRSEK
ncbi:exosortase F-associated protein [Leeuwenhoekiella aestuarii]|uniref:Exosortase F-associated protein n=1 Tax=Leeuwenhoekiella aestuarii TaxID=2249426 RepID=A0A4Q0NQI5_9FLAO|nr:exosortase F system-associated protein [Leeuwenhoekiella aestuarii]RXG12692.1 exosortase F-associated protein [Leeuwenhoekiella aestuarii]RXG14639.1 exosortase F-associated protein [Leeuwenhoekiella aestuarii]